MLLPARAFAKVGLITVEDTDIPGLELELRRPIEIRINESIVSFSWVDAAAAPPLPFIPGKYRGRIAASTCATSVRSGDLDLLRDDLLVNEGDRTAAIRVMRSDKCPTLSGTVHSASGDTWGAVLVVSESDHIEPEVAPIYEGRFETRGLIPGTYRVYAFRSLNGLEYANPEALREFPGQTVRLKQGGHAEVRLELIPRK